MGCWRVKGHLKFSKNSSKFENPSVHNGHNLKTRFGTVPMQQKAVKHNSRNNYDMTIYTNVPRLFFAEMFNGQMKTWVELKLAIETNFPRSWYSTADENWKPSDSEEEHLQPSPHCACLHRQHLRRSYNTRLQQRQRLFGFDIFKYFSNIWHFFLILTVLDKVKKCLKTIHIWNTVAKSVFASGNRFFEAEFS